MDTTSPDPGTNGDTHSEPHESLERDPDTAPNAPNRDPAETPDADTLVNQTDAGDGKPQPEQHDGDSD